MWQGDDKERNRFLMTLFEHLTSEFRPTHELFHDCKIPFCSFKPVYIFFFLSLQSIDLTDTERGASVSQEGK